jgi:hypothetical protein
MVDLKPCPFCGGDKIWVAGPTCKASDPYNPLDRLYPIAQCRGCHAEVPGKNEDYSYNQRTAVSAWNTRPDDARISALEAERDRLREALHNMIVLADPHFSDDAQMLALNEARAALGDSEGES